ncbi:acetate kinase [Clostridium sp. AF36-4]|uniref:acetate/propionate family kinase n=1 Tax=Clostridium sp. AF36-4 TaxID=2293015 RepID=UPI000E3F47D7|nr:acetate kinase [Clostridium sp. AF36-4]RGF53912.1 acetate kinase [Clostridium sp. AF36-4]
MKVLVINCGSSSLKYQLIDSVTEVALAVGLCERIGIDGRLNHTPNGGEKVVIEQAMPDHEVAIRMVLDALTNENYGVIKNLDEIDAIGHRLVHGGEKFTKSVIIDDEVIAGVEECSPLAPLHNPANLIGVRACQAIMPGVPNIGVFDTAFHQTMEPVAYMYGLPYEYYEKYKVRRYGFHGTSHSFVSKRAIQMLNLDPDNSKIIVCHLGNGSSISAVKNGKVVDTSMGMTPMEGLVMGTRCGDMDPTIVEYLAHSLNKSLEEVMVILNKKSGVLGISGVSSDFRDLDKASNEGNERAKLAVEVFSYRTAKYIGSYIAAMNGVDAIVFTAGLGENNIVVREQVLNHFGYMGITLDKEANQIRGEEKIISTPDSKVTVAVIPTNEELAIAHETVALLK